MLFIRFLNSGADTPATNATKTQLVTITGKKYKAMATYTLRHILHENGLKLSFKRSGKRAISIK
jgi:UDP-N-acetylmuramyl tripeptide synthase